MNTLSIEHVQGREIIDSRGNPTVEAEVWPVSYTHLSSLAWCIRKAG